MEGARVILRQWRDDDLAAFAEMNRDPRVMRYFPGPNTEDESRRGMERQRALIEGQGWGLWAVEVAGTFAGMTGLSVPRFSAPFTPCVEVGWRFRPEYWGRGVAHASAVCALRHAFGPLGLREVVSFTATANTPSRRLMERLGLERDPAGDFLHPLIAEDSPIRPHVLYRATRAPEPEAGGTVAVIEPRPGGLATAAAGP
jgi:RimJ/RimL family protein N-acetyltransferase